MNQEGMNIQTPSTDERYRKAQFRMLICFCVLIVGMAAFLSAILLNRFNVIIREKTVTMISANTSQLELNVNSYLERIETTATLLFSDERYFGYDATDPSMEKYDKIKAEEIISERITDLGLLENYSDFAIVYADDHTVGWFSNTTQALLRDKNRYEEFTSHIVNSRTEDGWFFELNGNKDRLYYVKRVNKNAVLVVSFYGRELESAFDYPKELEGMSIRLLDEDKRILFSTNKNEIGEEISEDIAEHIGEKGNRSVVTEEKIINTNVCKNGWKVVCSIPLNVILKETRNLIVFTVVFAVLATLGFMVMASVIFKRVNRSLKGLFTHLSEKAETDQLSGLLNKNSYGEQVRELLMNRAEDEHALMVVLDVDFFKPINDNMGHAHGDEVIAAMGKLLSEGFPERYILGRIGGDEFSAFCIYPIENKIDMRQRTDRFLAEIRKKFVTQFSEENRRFGTSMSAGVVLIEEKDDDYEALYKKADSALYISKENGKGRTSWYGEEIR